MKNLGAIALAAVIAIPMFGQTPLKPPTAAERAQQHVKGLTALLSLTSAQQQQGTAIFTGAARAEQTVHQNEKAAQENLSTAIRNNDAATIDQVSNILGQSMALVISIKAKADAAFYQVLTAEQQAKLSELESQHIGVGGPGGPGGPPPMGVH